MKFGPVVLSQPTIFVVLPGRLLRRGSSAIIVIDPSEIPQGSLGISSVSPQRFPILFDEAQDYFVARASHEQNNDNDRKNVK